MTQFKPRALEYIRRVQATGEEIILTRHGRPAVRILPYRQRTENRLRALRGTVRRYDDPEAPVDPAHRGRQPR